MDFLKDFNFFMFYIIHKMLALLKNHLNFLKDSIYYMKLYENTKSCYICEEKFENKYLKNKKYRKVKD